MPSFKSIDRSGERLRRLLETAKDSPMTDMRERLEKAVRDCAFLAGVDLSTGAVTIEDRIVNVILSALEEPSEEMVEAAKCADSWSRSNGETLSYAAVFNAMIRSAKGEAET